MSYAQYCSCDKCTANVRNNEKVYCEPCYDELASSYNQLLEQYEELKKKVAT